MSVHGYTQFGGRHPETAAMANVLAHAGVTAPHTNRPYTEEMLLGLCGGLGGGYWLFEMCGEIYLVLGGRHNWQDLYGKTLAALARRIGVRPIDKPAGGKKAAAANLQAFLEAGKPAITWVGKAGMPYWGLPVEWLKGFAHVAVICGHDEQTDRFLVDDLAGKPFTVTPRELEVARQGITSLKNRVMAMEPTGKKIDLKKAIRAGIRDHCRGLLKPPIKNFGLPAWEKWADLVANPKDRKGWPRVMPRGPRLGRGLIAAYRSVAADWPGCGSIRAMYADFLEEAAGVTKQKGLREAAAQYRAVARQWRGLANATLSSKVALFKEARQLIDARPKVFLRKGMKALPELRKTDRQLEAVQRKMGKKFPLDQKQVDALLQEMRKRLLAIHAAETRAVQDLQKLVK